jgi:hypothetical protein
MNSQDLPLYPGTGGWFCTSEGVYQWLTHYTTIMFEIVHSLRYIIRKPTLFSGSVLSSRNTV